MADYCKDRLDNFIEPELRKISQVVFNGYGSAIKETRNQVDKIERKLNWLLTAVFGLLASMLATLVSVIVRMI